MSARTLYIRHYGLQHYQPVLQAMHDFTSQRDQHTPDELWLLEHYPVFTQGRAGKATHLLSPGNIAVIQSDRGGQATYHGPGQQIMYTLLDLRRYQLSARQLVTLLEETVISTLLDMGISAQSRPDAPGVYLQEQKICSLGLRIRRGCSLHGLALNVAMDLEPFSRINPCGYPGLAMTQVIDHCPNARSENIRHLLIKHFILLLGTLSASVIHPQWLDVRNNRDRL